MDKILSGRRLNTSRNLFGYPEPGSISKYVENELKIQQKIDSFRWTFDFVDEKPLPPNELFAYDWTPVKPESASNTIDCSDRQFTSENTTTDDAAQKCTNNLTSNDCKKQQTQITDYMRKRKFSTENRGQNEKLPCLGEITEQSDDSTSKLARPSSSSLTDDQRAV